jgi:hypothetical protein
MRARTPHLSLHPEQVSLGRPRRPPSRRQGRRPTGTKRTTGHGLVTENSAQSDTGQHSTDVADHTAACSHIEHPVAVATSSSTQRPSRSDIGVGGTRARARAPTIITPPTLTPRRGGPLPLALGWSHRAGARHPENRSRHRAMRGTRTSSYGAAACAAGCMIVSHHFLTPGFHGHRADLLLRRRLPGRL